MKSGKQDFVSLTLLSENRLKTCFFLTNTNHCTSHVQAFLCYFVISPFQTYSSRILDGLVSQISVDCIWYIRTISHG